MKHHYHDTAEAGKNLGAYEQKAASQESKLLAYFESHLPDYILLTLTAALSHVFANTVPITSVRRAMSNLSRDGHLVQSGRVMGPYGRPEHYLRLAPRDPQQDMFG